MSHLRLTEEQVLERARKLKRLSGDTHVAKTPKTTLKTLPDKPKPHKYGAKPVVIDGIRFASQKEGRRYQELLLLQRSGEIRDLKLQPRIDICAPGYGKVCTYVADFFYTAGGHPVYEDCKGFKTQIYRLKKKLVCAFVGIDIKEI